MTPSERSTVPVFAATSKGREESRDRPFATVLSSLGIAELGKKNAGILIQGGFDSIDKLIEAAEAGSVSRFTALPGFGEVMAENVIRAFSDSGLLATVEALRDAGLHMSVDMDAKGEELPQVFAGQVWCITGSFENFNPRTKALAEVEARGGRTVSSVTSKTTHLLAGKGGGSKRAEAERLGVEIVDEAGFLKLQGRQGKEPGDGQLTLF